MKEKGFMLIELLVASALLVVAGAGVYAGIAQAIKAERKIRDMDALYDPFKFLWMKAEKDLRNSLSLRGYLFKGKADALEFPAQVNARIVRVRYFTKDGKLLRIEEALPEKFVKDRPAEEVLLKDIERIEFQYAYLDEEERVLFKPAWAEEPYFGTPKTVRLDVKLRSNPKIFSRTISIPQGRWGHE